MMNRRILGAPFVLAAVLSSAPALLAAVPVPEIYDQVWSHNATAAQDQLLIEHPLYILARWQGLTRATVRGEFPAHPALPGGTEVISHTGDRLEVWATREGLAALAADPRTIALHPPMHFVTLEYVSEARLGMAWAPYDAAGVGGQGVRVAVIDVGFNQYQRLLGSDLPASVYYKLFTSLGFPSEEPHGTAVAEIVHDIAPKADLYLLEISEPRDLTEAVDWCIDNNIAVVNMSLGFVAGPLDGSSPLSQDVNRAADAGIIWANAVGNEGYMHWGGTAVDADEDGYLEFTTGVEVVGFDYGGGRNTLFAYMNWDRWPSTTGLSFDLELYADINRTLLLTHSNSQPNINEAFRALLYANPDIGPYYLAIKHQFGTLPDSLRIDLITDPYIVPGSMSPATTSYSLTIPSDARGAIAVGAYNYVITIPGSNPARYYSSEGPTWDGRMKPDIAAGDGVQSNTWDFFYNADFSGTSAASPHIAGAAALLSSATVSGGLFTYIWSPEDFLRLLDVRSIDFGAVGPDNTYGYGGVVLPPASTNPDSFAVARVYPNPSNAGMNISFAARPGLSYAVRIYDILGRLVWETESMHVGPANAVVHWDGRDSDGEEVGSGVYFYRIDTDYITMKGKAVLLK